MPEPIGYQDGISSTQKRLEKLDPAVGEVAYANQAATLKTLKKGHNDVWKKGGIAEKVAALEARLQLRPFS